jgi:hypothetical protein
MDAVCRRQKMRRETRGEMRRYEMRYIDVEVNMKAQKEKKPTALRSMI